MWHALDNNTLVLLHIDRQDMRMLHTGNLVPCTAESGNFAGHMDTMYGCRVLRHQPQQDKLEMWTLQKLAVQCGQALVRLCLEAPLPSCTSVCES